MASNDLTNILMTIAVKAAKHLGGSYTDQAAIDFAWWSISEEGDAAEDETGDFGRHIRRWLAEITEGGMLDEYRPL